MKIELTEEIIEEFKRFCRLNKIQNVEDEAYKCFISGFNVKKYGPTPLGQQKVVEKVVEVENFKVLSLCT